MQEDIINVLKSGILKYVTEHPNTSSKYIIDVLVANGFEYKLVAKVLGMMKRIDKSLIVTDNDENGHVFLSIKDEENNQIGLIID